MLRRVFVSAGIGLLLTGSTSAAPPPSSPAFRMFPTPVGRTGPDAAARREWLERPRLARPLMPAPSEPDPLDVHWRSGFGLPVPDSYVSSLFVNDGVLVVGGGFRRIGDLEAPGLATWDGAKWSLLGSYPAIGVDDIAPYPGGFVTIGVGGQ